MPDDSVAARVQDLKKRQNFRQGATYAIQVLAQVMTPPRVGWERHAAEAFRAGAAEAISGVAAKHGTDPTIFQQSMHCLAAMASLPRVGAQMVGSGGLTAAVPAVAAFWEAGLAEKMGSTELAESMKSALLLFSRAARQDPEGFASTGAAQLAVRIAHNACGLGEQEGSVPLPTVLEQWAGLVDTLTRARPVQTALIHDDGTAGGAPALDRLAAMATTPIDDIAAVRDEAGTSAAAASASGQRTVTRRGSLRAGLLRSGSSGSRSGSIGRGWGGSKKGLLLAAAAAAAGSGAGNELRPGARHLAPTIRALERLSRSEDGLAAIQTRPIGGLDAVVAISGTLKELALDKQAETVAVRLLARLVAGDLRSLLARAEVEAEAESEEAADQGLACLVLACLCRDTEAVDALCRGGPAPAEDEEDDSDWLLRCVSLVASVASPQARASVVEVLRRAAARSRAVRSRLVDYNALAMVAWALYAEDDSEDVVGECGGCIAALIGPPAQAVPPPAPTPSGRAGWGTAVEGFERSWIAASTCAEAAQAASLEGAYSEVAGEAAGRAAGASAALHGTDEEGSATDSDESDAGLGELLLACLQTHSGSEGAAAGCLLALASLLRHGVSFPAPFRVALAESAATSLMECRASRFVAGLALGVILGCMRGLTANDAADASEGLGFAVATAAEARGAVRTAIDILSGARARATAALGGGSGGTDDRASFSASLGIGAAAGEDDEDLTAQAMLLLAAVLPASDGILREARKRGCINAVLAGATRHRDSDRVGTAFQQAVGALGISDDEVRDAVRAVLAAVVGVRAAFLAAGPSGGGGSADATEQVEDAARKLGPGRSGADTVAELLASSSSSASQTATAACSDMDDPLGLIEAVTLAPRFAAVAYTAGALPTLVLALGVVSSVHVIKTQPAAAKSGVGRLQAAFGGGGLSAAAEADAKPGCILHSTSDRALSRAAGALTNLCRACAEISGGAPGLTGAAEEEIAAARGLVGSDAEAQAMDRELHDLGVAETACRALTARPSSQLFALRLLPLLQWMTWGASASLARDRAAAVVQAGAVEAVSAAMRAQPRSMTLLDNVADALARIAESAKGAVAVATRGASRQLARQLDALAATRSAAADAVLLRFLQVLSVCAAGDETLAILRKQGLAVGLVGCSAAVLRKQRSVGADAEDEAGGAGGGPRRGGADGDDPAGSGLGAAEEGYVLDPAAGSSIQEQLSLLLGRLLTSEDVVAAAGRLDTHAAGAAAAVEAVVAAVEGGKRGRARTLKAWDGFDDGPGVEADAAQLALVAGVSAGRQAGEAVLSRGSAACGALVAAAVRLATALGGAGDDDGGGASRGPSAAHAALLGCVPSACRAVGELTRTLRVVAPRGTAPDWGPAAADEEAAPAGAALDGSAAEYAFDRDDGAGPGGDCDNGSGAEPAAPDGEGEGEGEGDPPGAAEAREAVASLLSALDSMQEAAGPAAVALAVVCARRGPAAQVALALDGRGVGVLVDVARTALDAGDQATLAAAMSALAGAARAAGTSALCASAGAAGLATQVLGELADEATAATSTAAMRLAAAVCRHEHGVTADILSAGALSAARSSVQHHCSDPYEPAPSVLAAAAGLTRLLLRALGASAGEEGARAEEARATARRIVRMGVSSTGYCDEPECAVPILRLIAATCSEGEGGAGEGENAAGGYGEEAAALGKQGMEEAEAERFVELALVSSSATPTVVEVGRRALSALGAGTARLAGALAEMRECTATAEAAAEAAEDDYEEGSASAAVLALRDSLRALSTAVVASAEEGRLEGAENWETFWCVDQAMLAAVAVSERVHADREGSRGVSLAAGAMQEGDDVAGDAAAAVVGCLSVGVQMAGRIATLVTAQFDAQLAAYYEGTSESWELEEGQDVPPLEVIRTATRVLSAGVITPAVVEAACGCVRAVVDSTRRADSLQACAERKTGPVVERLARMLGRLERRLRFGQGAGGSAAPASATAAEEPDADAGDDMAAAASPRAGEPSGSAVVHGETLTHAQAARAGKAARMTLQLLATATRGVLGELSNDEERAAAVANHDLVRQGMAAAASAAYWHGEAGDDDMASTCRALVGAIPEQLMDAEGGFEAAWALVSASAEAVEAEALAAPASERQGANGAALARGARVQEDEDADEGEQHTPEGARARVAVAREMVERLAARYVGGDDAFRRRAGPSDDTTPGTVSRLAALFAGLGKSADMVYGTGRVWRRTALQGGKSDDWSPGSGKTWSRPDADGGGASSPKPGQSRASGNGGGGSSTSNARAALRRVVAVIRVTLRLGGPDAARALVENQIRAGARKGRSVVVSEQERVAHAVLGTEARAEAAAMRDGILRLLAQVDMTDHDYEATDDPEAFEGSRSELLCFPIQAAGGVSLMDSLTDILLAPAEQHDPLGIARKRQLRVAGEETAEAAEGGGEAATAGAALDGGSTTAARVPKSLASGGSDADRVVTSAIDSLCRLIGVVPTEDGSVPDVGVLASRAKEAAASGVFRAVAEAMSARVSSPMVCSAALKALQATVEASGLSVKELGLNRKSLQAVQAAVRAHGEDLEDVRALGGSLTASLCAEFEEQSAEMLSSLLAGFLDAAEAVGGTLRQRDRKSGGARQWTALLGGEAEWEAPVYVTAGVGSPECPDGMAAVLRAATALDRCSRFIDDTAVGAVEPAVLARLAAVGAAHAHDPGIGAVVVGVAGRLAAQPMNVGHVLDAGLVSLAVTLSDRHPYCPRLLEGLGEMCLPMSFSESQTNVISASGATDALTFGLRRFQRRLTTHWGSPLQWPEPGAEEQNATPGVYKGPQAKVKNWKEPRLTKLCFQVLANMACENSEILAAPVAGDLAATATAEIVEGESAAPVTADGSDAPETSAPPQRPEAAGEPRGILVVSRFVELGGIAAMTRAMSAHQHRPRLLEDGLCLLSNVAFTGDDLQLAIGESCLGTVSDVLSRFHADGHLFRMALRAVGNLSRLDRNILRGVACDVAVGVVRGLRANTDAADVVKLGADVLGNLASVDDTAVDIEEGLALLRDAASASGHADTAAAAIGDGASLKGAICGFLHRAEAPEAILAAMDRFSTNASLLTSCLRALHYIAATPAQVEHLVKDLGSVSRVVLAMRSCDFDAELVRRGARVLGAALEVPTTHDLVMSSGAPQVLLGAADTHAQSSSVFFTCLSVAMLGEGASMFQAASELDSVQTTVRVASRAEATSGDIIIVLSLLNNWAQSSPALASGIATHGTSLCMLLFPRFADDLEMTTALLQFLTTVAAHVKEHGPAALLSGGIVSVCLRLADAHLALPGAGGKAQAGDPAAWRGAALQMLPMLRSVVFAGPNSTETFLEDGGATLLARLDASYRNLQVNGTDYYDRETVEAVQEIVAVAARHDPDGDIAEAFEGQQGAQIDATGAAAAAARSTGASLDDAMVADSSPSGAAPGPAGAESGASKVTNEAMMRYPDAPAMAHRTLIELDDGLARTAGYDAADGVPATVWGDEGSPHRRFLRLLVDGAPIELTCKLPAGKAATKRVWRVRLSTVRSVVTGLPPAYRPRMFGKRAKADTSIAMLGAGDEVLIHLEAASFGMRDVLAVALYAAARAAGGCADQAAPPA